MLNKSGKPPEDPQSYRPISLHPTILEKLFLTRLEPIIEEKQILPNHEFWFRGKHSTLEQSYRVVNEFRNALEIKKFCPAVVLDLKEAFDRVWFEVIT